MAYRTSRTFYPTLILGRYGRAFETGNRVGSPENGKAMEDIGSEESGSQLACSTSHSLEAS